MKKIMLALILGIFLVTLVSATDCKESEGCIGTFTELENVTIYQTCNNCTYCNFTKIRNNDNPSIIDVALAIQEETDFIYEVDKNNFSTYGLGKYKYNYNCGNDVDKLTGTLWFLISPSGESGTANIAFFIFIILLFYGITFIGVYMRNIPITILGGMAMLFLGIYIVNAGVIIYRDNITNYFAYLTIAIGFILAMWAVLDWFDISFN